MKIKIKVEATIELEKGFINEEIQDEIDWFESVLADKENTSLQLWSNDIGDQICSTKDFDYKIIYEQ